MFILLFGKPLVFWLGILALIFFITQIVSGVIMVKKGRFDFLKYHKINAFILTVIVFLHILYGLALYF